MAERFPCTDEQIESIKKNTMKEALKTIEAVNNALKGYEGKPVELEFNNCNKEELIKFVNQEDLVLLEPSEHTHYYCSMWKTEKTKVFFRTKQLKIKEIIFEDGE